MQEFVDDRVARLEKFLLADLSGQEFIPPTEHAFCACKLET